jgi:hypothetical protein
VTDDKLHKLRDTQNRLAEEALRRYHGHKGRSIPEAEARNMAVAQTRAALNFRYSSASIARELSRMLDPAPGPRWGNPPATDPRPPSGPRKPFQNWRMPT